MPESFHDLCCLRSTLEAFAAVRLQRNPRRKEVMERLRGYLAHLFEHATRGGYESFHTTDMALHRELVRSADLNPLTQAWEATAREIDATILGIKKSYWPSLMALYREHVYLLDAWNSHDLQVVERATHQHLEVGWYRMQLSATGMPPEGDAVDRVAAFLSTHYASEIDIKWVARNIGFVSESHLARRFRAQFGIAPYAWLRKLRLERAAQLLTSTHEEIVTIGVGVGYKNASHFTRDFRERFGKTPRQYRRESTAE